MTSFRQHDYSEKHLKVIDQLKPGMVVEGILGSTDSLYVVLATNILTNGQVSVVMVEMEEILSFTKGKIFPDQFFPDPIYYANDLGLIPYSSGVWNQNGLLDTGEVVSKETLEVATLIALNHLEHNLV